MRHARFLTAFLAATAPAIAAGLPVAARADDIVFSVRDRLATVEVGEVTTLYVDGQLVRSFRLDAEQRDIEVPVRVPDNGKHSFGLCGHILVRAPDGLIRKQTIKVTGTIEDVEGRRFEAVASNDFTRFYLVDTTEGRPAAAVVNEDNSECTPAVS